MKFNEKLVLSRYFFSLFGMEDFEAFCRHEPNMRADTNLEKIDEEGISLFYHLITSRFFTQLKIDKIKLLEYDNNIVRHTKALKRDLKWKYFQYLTLLFTEIYLDRYFRSKQELLQELNHFLIEFNKKLPKTEQIDDFKLSDLNKLAFWNATGSGKTLLMHMNILQFHHYNQSNHHKINKVLLITPNAGLSEQHLGEFEQSSLDAEIFSKSAPTLFSGNNIEIIEISKLKDKEGETTVAVDSFGNDNLVFIDEAHRGSSGDEWKTNRDKLSSDGFAFEYSATFGQAVNSASGKNKKVLETEYAKSILFDYSYKYFYKDGFGKDFTILNLKDEPSEAIKYNYLVGSLLSFYQQRLIFDHNPHPMKQYNIHNPLMVFVGGKVSQSISKEEGSDITAVLKFFEKFIHDKTLAIDTIAKVLRYQSGVTTQAGIDIFTGKFDYLSFVNYDAEVIYTDMLKRIFHGSDGVMHMDELKGCDGEIGLRIGEGEYFGVINIGITSDFKKLCESQNLDLQSKEFSKSLFLDINSDRSAINFLIGSRKFTEGWSSWRVSSMGLLNMGKSEGAQVIQLFGRGVRLKGRDMSLKRSEHYGKTLERKYTRIEQLNIFGLKANYMDEFRKYLENEGVPSTEMFDFLLPTIKDNRHIGKKLKVLRVREDKDFKRETKQALKLDTRDAIVKSIVVNLYAKAQVIGIEPETSDFTLKPNIHTFASKELAFIDMDKVFIELIRYKNERNYFNLAIEKNSITDFFHSKEWYKLEAPKGYFDVKQFSDFERIQDVFITLLKKYTDSFYKYHKNNWEKDFMVYRELEDNEVNFLSEYKISIESTDENSDLIEKILHLKDDLEHQRLPKNIDIGFFKSFIAPTHLFNPLFYKEGTKAVRITPIELNQGEMEFVEDLESYLAENPILNSEIFLLRNRSRAGIGFFEEGGFFPDFILWVLKDEKQYINFIDPKGIRNLNPKTDPKLNFYKSIKEKELNIGDSSIVLNSFIVSNTLFKEINLLNNDITKIELEMKNIMFQKDDKETYIGKIFGRLI